MVAACVKKYAEKTQVSDSNPPSAPTIVGNDVETMVPSTAAITITAIDAIRIRVRPDSRLTTPSWAETGAMPSDLLSVTQFSCARRVFHPEEAAIADQRGLDCRRFRLNKHNSPAHGRHDGTAGGKEEKFRRHSFIPSSFWGQQIVRQFIGDRPDVIVTIT